MKKGINKNQLAIETYDKIADRYHKEFGNDYSDTMYIDEFLNILDGKDVLDIGCGIGNLTNYVYEMGFHVIGIDKSSEMLKIARKTYPNLNLILMDMKNISLDKKYDGIILAYSLFHLTKKEVSMVLPNFYKLLKSKGKMLLFLQIGEGEHIIDEPLKEGLKMFINYYSLDEITNLLMKNNFKIVSTTFKNAESEFELGNRKLIIICGKN